MDCRLGVEGRGSRVEGRRSKVETLGIGDCRLWIVDWGLKKRTTAAELDAMLRPAPPDHPAFQRPSGIFPMPPRKPKPKPEGGKEA